MHPPNLPLRFFRWFCHPEYAEDIEGALLERFERHVGEKGGGSPGGFCLERGGTYELLVLNWFRVQKKESGE